MIIWDFFTHEPVRHDPGSRAYPAAAAPSRFAPRFCKTLGIFPEINLIIKNVIKRGVYRYAPQFKLKSTESLCLTESKNILFKTKYSLRGHPEIFQLWSRARFSLLVWWLGLLSAVTSWYETPLYQGKSRDSQHYKLSSTLFDSETTKAKNRIMLLKNSHFPDYFPNKVCHDVKPAPFF